MEPPIPHRPRVCRQSRAGSVGAGGPASGAGALSRAAGQGSGSVNRARRRTAGGTR